MLPPENILIEVSLYCYNTMAELYSLSYFGVFTPISIGLAISNYMAENEFFITFLWVVSVIL